MKHTRLLSLLLCVLVLATSCGVNHRKEYDDGVEAFADGDYAAAALHFEKLGDYSNAATYAAYSRGLALYEQGQYIEAEPYFATVRDFMYGETRYQYCHGCLLESQESFREAADTFLALGDYEDSKTLYHYNNARYAEQNADYASALLDYELAGDHSDAALRLDSLRTQVYDSAVLMMADGYYEQALNLFSLLGSYYDSAEQARICKQHFRDARYAEAEAFYNSGDLQAAYDIFLSLSGYSDATTRAEEIGQELGIALPDVD